VREDRLRKDQVCLSVGHRKNIWFLGGALTIWRRRSSQLERKPRICYESSAAPVDSSIVNIEAQVSTERPQGTPEFEGHDSRPTADIENMVVRLYQFQLTYEVSCLTSRGFKVPDRANVAPQPERRQRLTASQVSQESISRREKL
jgi:hypothetical protein